MTGIISDNVGRPSGLIKAAAGGGGVWTLISTFTSDGSDATATFDSGIDSTYPIYVFKFISIHPETDNKEFQVNFRDGSTAYDATKTTVTFNAHHDEGNTAAVLGYDTNADIAEGTGFQLLAGACGADADQCISGYMWLFNPSSTVFIKHFIARISGFHAANYAFDFHTSGYCNVTAAIDGVQFKFDSGEIQGGKIKMYGLKDSA